MLGAGTAGSISAQRLGPRRANVDLPSVCSMSGAEQRLSSGRGNVGLPTVPLPLPISRHVSIPSTSSGSPSSGSRLQAQSAQGSSGSSLASGAGAGTGLSGAAGGLSSNPPPARPPFPRVRTTSISSPASSSIPSPSLTGFPQYLHLRRLSHSSPWCRRRHPASRIALTRSWSGGCLCAGSQSGRGGRAGSGEQRRCAADAVC